MGSSGGRGWGGGMVRGVDWDVFPKKNLKRSSSKISYKDKLKQYRVDV